MAVVVKDRVCRLCGVVFPGGPRAWYCPACREERKREAQRRFRAKGRKADRQIGSTDTCTRCGKEYIVNSARQKYCPDCSYDGVREVDRAASLKWNKSHKDTYYPERNEKRRCERSDVTREKERKYRLENPEVVIRKREMDKIRAIYGVESARRGKDGTIMVTIDGVNLIFSDSESAYRECRHISGKRRKKKKAEDE